MKPRYDFLDGLRGVAALAVVVLHASQIFHLREPAEAALAVDFFFCLSGFVIAHAYDGRLASGKLGVGSFCLKRVQRLYPMILAGTALGAIATALSATHGAPQPAWHVVSLASSAAVLLPLGLAFGLQAFPINPPLWSLFFEAVANVVYGFERRRLGLGALIVFAALLGGASWLFGGLIHIGFQGVATFLAGFVRVAYPFLAGVLIHRLKLTARPGAQHGLLIAAGLIAALLTPVSAGRWLYELVVVVAVFPLIVSAGAGVTPSPLGDAVWRFAGRLSYPLYAVHYPLLRLWEKVYNHGLNAHLSASVSAMLGVGVAVAGSTGLLLLYDEPVRAWMGEARGRRLAVT